MSAGEGRWQLRLWWKPFVTLIWYGGVLIALGGLLAMLGHLRAGVRRSRIGKALAERRAERADEAAA